LKEFRAERVMLEKSFAAYKAKLEAVTSAVEKPSKDTLVTLQNDFVYHANTLSTHCSLFARSISKLNSDDSKTTDAALKQLVKELAGDILGIRKLVSHEGQIAYAKNYGLGDHPPVY
jgi:hypothetical protein